MDYCSSCRRHLNGALVCPGCGAYAPDIAPPADGRIDPGPGTVGEAVAVTAASELGVPHLAASEFAPPDLPASEFGAPGLAASQSWHDGGLRDETAGVGADADDASKPRPAGNPEGAPPPSRGRAARRRQLARWEKNKRRAVVATAVALVGGGLTLSATDRQSADRAQAATAPKDVSTGVMDEAEGEHTDPTSAEPSTQRSSVTSRTQPTATSLPRRQPVFVAPHVASPRTPPTAAVTPHPTATSSPQPQTASQSSGSETPASSRTAPTGQHTSAPAEGPTSGGSQASPSPTATSPSKVCVLVVCLD